MKEFFRVVDTDYEKTGIIIDTDTADLSPRMMETVRLTPIFDILFPFWEKSGLTLASACDGMLKLSIYLEEVQRIEASGGDMIPTRLFNLNEPIKEIPLNTLKMLIFPYYDLYQERGLSLDFDEVQYIWEYLWMRVKNSFYPDKISRFRSVFLFDDFQQAKLFKEKYHLGDRTKICSVDLIETSGIEKYDSAWLDNVPTDCTFTECVTYIRNYWEGKYTDNPNQEYLFMGKYRLSEV